jgi:hypothetical protein
LNWKNKLNASSFFGGGRNALERKAIETHRAAALSSSACVAIADNMTFLFN